MFLRIKPHITLLAVILFSGCAYYNTFYNAQEYYNEAEKLRLEKGCARYVSVIIKTNPFSESEEYYHGYKTS